MKRNPHPFATRKELAQRSTQLGRTRRGARGRASRRLRGVPPQPDLRSMLRSGENGLSHSLSQKHDQTCGMGTCSEIKAVCKESNPSRVDRRGAYTCTSSPYYTRRACRCRALFALSVVLVSLSVSLSVSVSGGTPYSIVSGYGKSWPLFT